MAMQITPDTPAMPPPKDQTSNFVDPPDYYEWTFGVGVASMVIMTLAVAMRVYTKAFLIRQMKHEDYVAILALCAFLVWDAMYIYIASLGITRDLWNIRAMDMSRLLFLMNVIQVLYGPAMLAAKYFVIVQLKRIFCPTGIRGSVWWALNGLIVATVIYYVSCFFTFLFQCVPREKIWNPMLDGTCIDNNSAILSAGLINLLLDVGILIVPIWAVSRLQLTRTRKLGVMTIFAVGFITCGFAAAGVAYRVPMMSTANQTNAIAKVGLWTFAELAGTIVVGCMPIIPRFYEVTLLPGFTSLRGLTSRSRRSQNSTMRSGGTGFSSTIKVENKVVISDASIDSEYIELRDPKNSSDRNYFHETV